jgi:ADP-heptose:LPS heptosyltransferase/predicted SAM-dependent methyltransferase
MVWRADDPEGNEAAKVRWELVPYTRGFGYDLGCGPHKAYPHFIGLDNCVDTKLFNIHMKPDLKIPTCERLTMFASQSADFVFSSHLLEHIEDYKAALKEWWRVVKVGGHLCLYLPHKAFYPNIGTEGANPDHKHDFHPDDITAAMEEVSGGWDLVENQARNEGTEYSFFQVYRKLGHRAHLRSCDAPKPDKTCAVVRYGAFGDLIMTSSVLAQLKKQGYHITLYSVPRGYEVVKHDPNIDRVVLQDQDQVPNAALGDFFEYIEKKYDKFVNLSGSVEETLLAMHDRSQAKFSHAARHSLMNRNYVEFAHLMAEVPYEFGQRFYATPEEKDWARKERARLGGDYMVLWSLAGSSVHKHWPHMDQIIARMLLSRRDVRIVLVGDENCQILEGGWEGESRVVCRSGKWTIRQSLAFLEQCDLVIGPETGVLNAAALMPVPKIVFLSHSSHENLTRDWTNVTALEPQNTPCYPCHILHYSFASCREGFIADPEKPGEMLRVGALCQVNITPDQMWNAVAPLLLKREAA